MGVARVVRGGRVFHEPQAIAAAYERLLRLGRAFRTLKSLLRVRSAHHFHGRCIRVHISLCVLRYPMANHLRQRSLRASAPCSAQVAVEALEPLRLATYHLPGVSTPIRTPPRPIPNALTVAGAEG